MLRAYTRCNGGHYFVGEFCPLDGWSPSESRELIEAAAKVLESGGQLSLLELEKVGMTTASLKRVIVIQFGSEQSAFDALAPDGYFINGKWHRLRDLGDPFK